MSDEDLIAEQIRKAAEQRQKQEEADIYHVMSSKQGRRLIWSILQSARVFASTFAADPHVTAFNEGQRNGGLIILSRVMAVCPDLYLTMANEAKEEQQQ
ncbi:hypothetical protein SOASR014_37810 [Pectobacterium carotovorum subsp. carotovorum]|nr:hypothetical protein SOASR014_37810 [Pectobacterium carotovorum subsp. carotovorum]GLX46169.1 hypothetical protein Pcaca01_38370 [Pectobacterium carotovorum subsp. carotovorum]